MSRLKELFNKEIKPSLKQQFGYKNHYMVPELQKIVQLDMNQRKNMRVVDYFTYIVSGVVNKELAYRRLLDVKSDEDQMRLEDVLWYNNYLFNQPCAKTITHAYSMRTIQMEIFKTVYIGLYRLNMPHELILIIWEFV